MSFISGFIIGFLLMFLFRNRKKIQKILELWDKKLTKAYKEKYGEDI